MDKQRNSEARPGDAARPQESGTRSPRAQLRCKLDAPKEHLIATRRFRCCATRGLVPGHAHGVRFSPKAMPTAVKQSSSGFPGVKTWTETQADRRRASACSRPSTKAATTAPR
jgi:hypothetical protein